MSQLLVGDRCGARAVTGRELFVALVVLASATAGDARSQSIRGSVVAEVGSDTVAGAVVALLDTLGSVVAEVRTDQDGQFTLQTGPGLYRLRILHPGFAPTVTEALRVRDEDATLRVIVRVPVASAVRGEGAFALAPVVVEGRPATRHLAAFERRRVAGLGDFVTRDEFEVWRPQEVTDILRRMPSFVVRANPNFGRRLPDGSVDTRRNLIESRGLSNRRTFECPPLVFLDGAFVGDARTFDAELLPIDAIDAVETYSRPAQVPPELNRQGAQCGVLAFWTREPGRGVPGRSRVEIGLRYGGSVSDGEFGWGRVGLHMVARLVGPLELYPAFHVIVNLPSPGFELSNSGWHAHLALRVRPLGSLNSWYLGTGVGVSEVTRRVWDIPTERESVDVAHILFTGVAVKLGVLIPFVEAHLVDVITFSDLEAQLYLGLGARI